MGVKLRYVHIEDIFAAANSYQHFGVPNKDPQTAEETMQGAGRTAGTETVARMRCRGASPYTPTATAQPGLQKHKHVCKITNN